MEGLGAYLVMHGCNKTFTPHAGGGKTSLWHTLHEQTCEFMTHRVPNETFSALSFNESECQKKLQRRKACSFGSIFLLVWMIASFALVVFSVRPKEQIEPKQMKFTSLRCIVRRGTLYDFSIWIVINIREDSAGCRAQVKKKKKKRKV